MHFRTAIGLLAIVTSASAATNPKAAPPATAQANTTAGDSARTVQYHNQDIVPIHAKLKYTTLIVVPPTEKIMEAATGDKDFWIVDVVGNFCFVHPAKAGISSNLNLITDKGTHLQLYASGHFRFERGAGSQGDDRARRPQLHHCVERTQPVRSRSSGPAHAGAACEGREPHGASSG